MWNSVLYVKILEGAVCVIKTITTLKKILVKENHRLPSMIMSTTIPSFSGNIYTIGNSRAHSPTFPSLHLRHNSFSNPSVLYVRHSSFSNPSVASPMSQFILQPFFQSPHLHHNSFSNPSVALPTSPLILQPFCCFTYVTVYSPTLLSLLLLHKLFT